MTGRLQMLFGGTSRVLEKQLFQYNEDPVIESVESGVPGQIKIPKGIPAGGIKITVTGNNFRSIQSPEMSVYYEQKIFLSVRIFFENFFTKLNLKHTKTEF